MRFEFEVERAGEQGPGETPLDEWALRLPRRCDSWEIGEGSLGEVLAAAREFRASLDKAIRVLEREEALDGNEPARYAKARAAAACSLRQVEQEAAEVGFDVVAGLARFQAELLERPSPFASMARPAPEPSPGCYEASFGWVHMKPGCRCVR